MPFNIAIIAEVPTDVAVIETIVSGITGTADNNFTYLRPETTSGRVDPSKLSNWSQVLAYCASEEFRGAFAFQDFVVIQIDTDQHDAVNFNIPAQENGKETTPERKYELAKAILVSRIGEFYESVREHIVFAICVESMECWLLPLFFASVPSKRSKTKNCYDTLSSHEQARPLEKSYARYQQLSKPFTKKKAIALATRHSMSLALFVADAEECLRQFPAE